MTPQLLSIMAQILACQAQVLGMQADNMQRAAIGDSMVWTGADFAGPAAELERLSEAAKLA